MILLGLEVHLVWSLLTVLSVTMVILGGMVNYFETFLPTALNEAFRYGKASRGRPSYWPLRLIQASAGPIPQNQESQFLKRNFNLSITRVANDS